MVLLLAIVLLFSSAVSLRLADPHYSGRAIIVSLILFVAGLFSAYMYFSAQNLNCEERGGVYLAREGKCVRGIEEV